MQNQNVTVYYRFKIYQNTHWNLRGTALVLFFRRHRKGTELRTLINKMTQQKPSFQGRPLVIEYSTPSNSTISKFNLPLSCTHQYHRGSVYSYIDKRTTQRAPIKCSSQNNKPSNKAARQTHTRLSMRRIIAVFFLPPKCARATSVRPSRRRPRYRVHQTRTRSPSQRHIC